MKNLKFTLVVILIAYVVIAISCVVVVVKLKAMSLNEFIVTVVLIAAMAGYSHCFIKYPEDFRNGHKRS